MVKPIRDILLAIGEAIRREMLRGLNENGRFPLRAGSKLARTLRVEVKQGRGAGGRFEGYTANASLTLYAEQYAQWVDSGRKKFAKRVPLQAIIQFIKDRNLRLRDKKTGRYARKTYRGRERSTGRFVSINRLAFMIQNAIYKNGIRGRHFIQPAFTLGGRLVELHLNDRFLDSITLELEHTIGFK